MSQYYHDIHYHRQEHKHRISTFIAWMFTAIGGFIVLLLAARFVMSVMEVDRATAFASFIYSASHPFVAPLFALFNYQPQQEILRFEYQTILAIALWSLLTWFVAYSIRFEPNEE